jgi:hypothetical protein
MECGPTVSVATDNVATPWIRLLIPIGVVPSMNVTVPVGTAVPPLTVAVNVIEPPTVAGLGEEVREVELAAATVMVTGLVSDCPPDVAVKLTVTLPL